MYYISRIFFTCCLVLVSACPALAELKATFINRTDFEIQSISIKGDGGSMEFTVRVVPGNFCVFTDGNSNELHEVTIDAGLMLFTFTDMAALADNAAPTLELTYDADGRPHLTLVDKPAQADSGSVPERDSFDLPAGPIWNNDHAKKRCPQVLEEWLAANPGKKAEWNGNWATVKPGEMSVCGITVTGADNIPAPVAVPSLINLVGTASAFADPSAPTQAEFTAILSAKNLYEIREMGAQNSSLWHSKIYLPASFAGRTWAVFVESAEAFSGNDADKPGTCILRTYTGGPEGVIPLMQGLAAEGYRPWFAQLSTGEDMNTEEMVKLWEEYPDAAEAWEQVADACADVNRGGEPAAVDVVLLTEEGYAKAAKSEEAALPGFRLRVSNAVVVTMQYMPDISTLIGMTR